MIQATKYPFLINYPILSKFSELTHFCTTRFGGVGEKQYGSFSITPFTGDNSEVVSENRKLLIDAVDVSDSNLIFPFQTHSDNVKIIDNEFLKLSYNDRFDQLNGFDALITIIPGICIGVTTADCVPVLLFDKVNKVIAVAHAGWRGTCNRIVQKTIVQMQQNYGSKAENIVASIGVSISPDVYNVGEELIEEFSKQHFETQKIFIKRTDGLFLNLWEANRLLLTESGVPNEQVEIAEVCSFTENEQFFSARKLGIKSGRMLSGLMLK